MTLAARLVSVLADDLKHVGQAEYVRGLLPDGVPKRRPGGRSSTLLDRSDPRPAAVAVRRTCWCRGVPTQHPPISPKGDRGLFG